jgi:hypothetical protein
VTRWSLVFTPGKCCGCGYEGDEETPCPRRKDEIHCNHYWDGPEEDGQLRKRARAK